VEKGRGLALGGSGGAALSTNSSDDVGEQGE
jgi:hypothetical protein